MGELKTQSAIIMQGPKKAHVEHGLAIPSPDAYELLIKVHAVALNPSDWMALDHFGKPGAGAGYDFAGEVVEIGENVKSQWAVGDRVAGFVHGCHAANYTIGAFREYLIADSDLVLRLPDHVSYEAASTLGMGISTSAQALYQSLKLPLPSKDPTPANQTILIYGGATATGSIAIQLAKLSGLHVITTCSEQSISWMRSLGADEVVDYKQPNAVQQVVDCVQDSGLYAILDCIGKESTADFCSKCFTPPKDHAYQPEYVYAPLMPLSKEFPRPSTLPSSAKIQNKWKFVYTCFGKRFTTPMDHPAINGTWQPSVEDKAFMVTFYREFEPILASEKLIFMPQEVQLGGLHTILDGISLVRAGKVHGKKLVYPI
ncbi:Protein TOXD [Penicillium brevicompactum]|uniref:uncharacterized protein n=1 Tax=Penicillium brevicompactum TaxID=5074 RepID=UPI0025414CF0|nr:uncharacterized protein N7506_002694 [Penicillium brevicompactum]KAJ5344329.1 hypothetical protein N7506_002694 [Penicillium brevicompactum]